MLPSIPGLSMPWLKIGAAVAVLVVVGWLLWSRAEWKADAKEAQGQVARLLDVNKLHEAAERDMLRHRDTLAAALDKRETELRELETRSQAQRREWERMVLHDQDVAAWAAAPVPAAVRGFLRGKD